MKTLRIPLIAFLLSAGIAISAADGPRVDRNLLTSIERSLTQQISALWKEAVPYIPPTRGVYIEGYGVVITAEVNLVTPPGGGLMGGVLDEEGKAAFHSQRVKRVPELKNAMQEMLVSAATQLNTLPSNEQVAIAFILPRPVWEPAAGVPLQVTASAAKKDLLLKSKAMVTAAIKFSEAN